MDYRIKQNRRAGFKKWYSWSLENKDCDPAIWLTNYIFKRYEFNSEQRLWLAWLYANTYYLPTSFILWNEFPDYQLVDPTRLKVWNNLNYKRLRYQTDTKYNKGHLPKMFESYQKTVGEEQSKYFDSLLGDNEAQNFENLWAHVNKNFYKFGRYTTWFYLQTLNQCCKIPMQPSSLMLSDYSGSKSHRNGLCYALGKDEWINTKLTNKEYEYLESEAKNICNEIKHPDSNPFTLETCLCSYKKIFRSSKGRYLGYYLDRQAEEITKVQNDNWIGIDWNVFWQAREETLLPTLSKKHATIQQYKFTSFLNTGKIEFEPNNEGVEAFL